jgi:hypothetical protein
MASLQTLYIPEPSSEYNDNLLSIDSTLDNILTWNVTSGSATVSNATDNHFQGQRALKVVNFDGLSLNFNTTTNLGCTIQETGSYIFSYRIMHTSVYGDDPYFGINIFVNGVLLHNIGSIFIEPNNPMKWLCFAQNFDLNSGDVVSFNFSYSPGGDAGTIWVDGLKLERNNLSTGIPTAYSFPIGYFQQSVDFTQIQTDVTNLKSVGGWAQYVDNLRTTTSPLVITDTVNFTTIPCDGATKDETQLPLGFTELFNTTTNKLVAKNVNDKFLLNVRFKARTSAANSSFTIGVDIGATNLISPEDRSFSVGANTQQEFSYLTTYFTRETFIANGGLIKIRPRSGTLSIYDISVIPELTHKSR